LTAAPLTVRKRVQDRPSSSRFAPLVQAKLRIGPANDPYEQEADRVAQEVVTAPEPAGPESPVCATSAPGSKHVQCACAKCRDGGALCPECDDEQQSHELVRIRIAPQAVHPVPETAPQTLSFLAPNSVQAALRTPGHPLDASARQYMEPRFGHDFSDVRVHTDPQADRSARNIGALAYASGDHVVFRSGQYSPETEAGRRLLAHELTHVISQGGANALVQRDDQENTVTIELCFVPIHAYHLSEVGGVHAVINIPAAGGTMHVEVDPSQHMGVQDPGRPQEGPGHVGGLHSHVVVASGARSGGACQSFPVAPSAAATALDAARRYEMLDVSYEPPGLGPNSNSFGEWVLHEAGVDTSLIATPPGALGWGYYLDNPADRAHPPRVARTYRQTLGTCRSPITPAASFAGLVDLVRRAETEMTANGITVAGDRLAIIRGIYYGTPWSRDFGTSQGSHAREAMFNVYAGAAEPANPLRYMDCGTYLSLAQSQDITDHGRQVDVGHMIMGMDARRSTIARNVTQPLGQVTGLEAVTWAGDLGGAAARVALDRIRAPSTPATTYFRGTDYGGPINLEGDVAAYAVGRGPVASGEAPPLAFGPGQTIADMIEAYLVGTGTPATRGWDSRCRVFLEAMGGTFSSTGTLTNRGAVLSYLAEQIHDFGCWYLVTYQRSGGPAPPAMLAQASCHMEGASNEVAELFLGALERCVANPALPLRVTGPAPTPTPIGTESCRLARVGPDAGEALERGAEWANETYEDASRWVDQQRRAFESWWNE
jgi:hypothetical protein